MVVRQHKINLATRFLPVAAAFIAIIAAILLIRQYAPFANALYTCLPVFLFLVPVAMLALCLKSFSIIIEWMLDVTIITTERLITVEEYSLFHWEISTLQLERVQDVVVDIKGVLQNFFNFGTVTVQTASESAGFEMPATPQPFAVKEQILRLVSQRTHQPYDQNQIGV